MRRTVLLLALLACAVAPAHPQERTIQSGDRLRVSVQAGGRSHLVGSVKAITGDLLVLRTDDQAAHAEVPLGSITAVEISAGMHSKAKQGALLGFAVGAVVGYSVGACDPSADPDCWDDMELVAAPVVGAAGALLGLAVGAAYRSESWTQLPLRVLGVRAHGGGRVDLRVGSFRLPR